MNLKISHKKYILNSLFLLMVLIYIAIIFYSGSFHKGLHALYNSDNLYLPTLFKNIFDEGGNFTDWYLTPAPYIFPDMLVYFIMNYLTQNEFHAMFLFVITQMIFVFILMNLIFREFFSSQKSFLYAIISITFLYAIPSNLTTILMFTGFHMGAFISGLALVYLVVLSIKESNIYKIKSFIRMSLLISLIVLSDKIFIVQFVVPTIVTLIIMWLMKSISFRKVFIISSVIIISTGLGMLLYDILVTHPITQNVSLSTDNIARNIIRYKSKFYRLYKSNPILFLCIITYYIYLLIVTFRIIKQKKIVLQFIYLFTILSALCCFLVFLLSNTAIVVRYFLPFFFLPLILTPLAFGLSRINNIFIYLYLILVGYTLYSSLSIIKNNKFQRQYYPDYAQCFDRFVETTGAQRGISGYWQAKRLSMMSKNKVKIEQVTKKLKPNNWITSKVSLDRVFDFIIIRKKGFIKNQPDISLIYSVNYLNKSIPVSEIYTCGWFDVYYYNDGFRIK